MGLARATLSAWPTTVATAMASAIAPASDERAPGRGDPLVEPVEPVAHQPPGDRPGDEVGDDHRPGELPHQQLDDVAGCGRRAPCGCRSPWSAARR